MKFLKKYKLLLMLLVLIPFKANALSITSMSCSPSSVTSGDTFTATITVNSDEEGYFEKQGGMIGSSNLRSGGGDDSVLTESATSSLTFTHTFTALDPGVGTIYFTANLSDFTGDNEREVSASCQITINAKEVPSAPSSPASANVSGATSNNNNSNSTNTTNRKGSSDSTLKSLSVDKGKLNPTFDSEKFDYSLSVNNDVEKITISAEKNNENASIDGLGEKELKVGVNTFEIKVTSENGESRTYTLTVTRKEKDAIEITINKKKYTVIKNEGILNPPEGFVKTNVVIDKQDVIAYSNKYTGYILVGLIDENGKANFYIYNSKNSTYAKYSEVTSKGLRLVILDDKNIKVPSNYKKTTLELENDTVNAYYIKGVKNFKLVYAINMNTGDKDFYEYDEKENTFQRYNEELVKTYEDQIKLFEMVIVGTLAVILIMFIIIISLIHSNKKIKKGYKEIKENKVIDNIIHEEREKIAKQKEKNNNVEEPPKEENEEDDETPSFEGLSRRELKRLKKEEKRKLKEMQDDFLS